MGDKTQANVKKDGEALDEKELEEQEARELPDREALSIADPGDSLGSPPLTP